MVQRLVFVLLSLILSKGMSFIIFPKLVVERAIGCKRGWMSSGCTSPTCCRAASCHCHPFRSTLQLSGAPQETGVIYGEGMENGVRGKALALVRTTKKRGKSALLFIDGMYSRFLLKVLGDVDSSSVIRSASYTVLSLCMAICVLGSLGLDTKPLLSLFTVTGLTFGLALQKMLGDVFGALYVLAIRPFKRGDVVSIGSEPGKLFGPAKVLSIDMNFVKLLQEGDTEVLIPTSSVYGRGIYVSRSASNS